VSPRDLVVLDALRQDRDDCGPGLSKAVVEEVGATRFADGLIDRLCRQRYLIGVVGGLFQLGEESDVERAANTAALPTAATAAGERVLAPCASSSVSGSLDVTQPTLFSSGSSHYDVEREAA
jgi:hypothetical protein